VCGESYGIDWPGACREVAVLSCRVLVRSLVHEDLACGQAGAVSHVGIFGVGNGGIVKKKRMCMLGRTESISWIRRGVTQGERGKGYNKKETQFAKQRSRR
jgi:hypothetical protein